MNLDPICSSDSAEPALVRAINQQGGNGEQGPRDFRAAAIGQRHGLWSLGAGLIPVPLADIGAVTAIQMDGLQQLSRLMNWNYPGDLGKSLSPA